MSNSFKKIPGVTQRDYSSMCVAPNGNVYACIDGGDIYMQTDGKGDFNALVVGASHWGPMCAAPNGEIWVCRESWVYRSTNGLSFNVVSYAGGTIAGICAMPDNNVHICDIAGYWFKLNLARNQFSSNGLRTVYGTMTSSQYGGVWLAMSNGDIYLGTSGLTFTALNQTPRDWKSITEGLDKNVYACVNGGDIYIKTPTSDNFIPLGQTGDWNGMASGITWDRSIYASTSGATGTIWNRDFGNFFNFFSIR